jgi:hypothetical protein
MKTLSITILAAFISVGTYTAFAGDTIEDAFGKSLGAVFDPGSSLGTSKLTNGTVLYQFARNESAFPGFRAFDTYYVMLTPSSHKIYSILGVGSVTNKEAGVVQQVVIMELLRFKYGNELKQADIGTTGDVQRIDQGSRHAISRLTDAAGGKIELQFLDSDLEKLAQAEKLATESKK